MKDNPFNIKTIVYVTDDYPTEKDRSREIELINQLKNL